MTAVVVLDVDVVLSMSLCATGGILGVVLRSIRRSARRVSLARQPVCRCEKSSQVGEVLWLLSCSSVYGAVGRSGRELSESRDHIQETPRVSLAILAALLVDREKTQTSSRTDVAVFGSRVVLPRIETLCLVKWLQIWGAVDTTLQSLRRPMAKQRLSRLSSCFVLSGRKWWLWDRSWCGWLWCSCKRNSDE